MARHLNLRQHHFSDSFLVHFKLFDDSTKSVKPSTLSAEDQEWMRKLISADRKAKKGNVK